MKTHLPIMSQFRLERTGDRRSQRRGAGRLDRTGHGTGLPEPEGFDVLAARFLRVGRNHEVLGGRRPSRGCRAGSSCRGRRGRSWSRPWVPLGRVVASTLRAGRAATPGGCVTPSTAATSLVVSQVGSLDFQRSGDSRSTPHGVSRPWRTSRPGSAGPRRPARRPARLTRRAGQRPARGSAGMRGAGRGPASGKRRATFPPGRLGSNLPSFARVRRRRAPVLGMGATVGRKGWAVRGILVRRCQ